jgi:hypothetical protein
MPFRSAFLAIAVAATALFSVPQSARAELLLFTITGHINANFTLDSNAAPDSTDIFGAPSYLNVVGSFSGGPPFTFPILQFFDGIHSGGGLLLWQLPDIIYVSLANGPHLYSNSPPAIVRDRDIYIHQRNSGHLKGRGCCA